ncbi:MAG: hypothetical protein HY652_13665 [Acidobacteria bacterium]|nr:hypothetical protein [Acidobacteriota bacterium]
MKQKDFFDIQTGAADNLLQELKGFQDELIQLQEEIQRAARVRKPAGPAGLSWMEAERKMILLRDKMTELGTNIHDTRLAFQRLL